MIKVGLLFGSFDPPHQGHACLARSAWNQCNLDEVWLIPAWNNPWKDNQLDFNYRKSMCDLLIKDYNWLKVNPIEKYLKTDSTYQVLNCLKDTCINVELYIILTNETYLELPKWKNGNNILKDFNLLIQDKDFIYNGPDYHSTDVRIISKLNNSVEMYTNKEIEQYINANKFYR